MKFYIKYYLVRPVSQLLGSDRFIRPSLNELDKIIEQRLNFDEGTFLEIGANDGYSQSNTYYLEKFRNWRGVLIEPIPSLYKRCKRIRKNSQVFNYICSNSRESGSIKTIHYANLMSQVKGTFSIEEKEVNHIKKARRVGRVRKKLNYRVKCKTLTEIIDSSNFNDFDLISIDVEGYEFQVLKGLNLTKHTPKYLLVEVWPQNKSEVINYLNEYFKIDDYLTDRDILFKRKDI